MYGMVLRDTFRFKKVLKSKISLVASYCLSLLTLVCQTDPGVYTQVRLSVFSRFSRMF